MNEQEINLDELQPDVDLSQLTDQQKMWMTQLSYLDISEEGREKARNGELTVAELKDYLANPDKPYFGTMGMSDQQFDGLVSGVIGEETPLTMTNEELLEAICANGLGGLKIKDASDEQTWKSSGFQAFALEDSHGNVGISYRGSDVDLSRGGVRDWIEGDFLEYFKDGSTQEQEAKDFFTKHKSPDGNNYVYGHSLGGNLTQHVFVDNHAEIRQAFTINANPINQRLIDTPEKVAAFNDPERHSFNAVCGDVVSQLKDCSLYEGNINYIHNEGKYTGLLSHLVQASQFNQDGSFVKADKAEMQQELGKGADWVLDKVRDMREGLNQFEAAAAQFKDKLGDTFNNYKNQAVTYLQDLAQQTEIGRALHLDKAMEMTKDIDLETLGEVGAAIQTGNVAMAIDALEDIDLDKLGGDLGNWFEDITQDIGIGDNIDFGEIGEGIGEWAEAGLNEIDERGR